MSDKFEAAFTRWFIFTQLMIMTAVLMWTLDVRLDRIEDALGIEDTPTTPAREKG